MYSAFTPNPARVYAHTLCTRTASTTPHPTPPSPHTVEVKRLSLAERRTHPTLHPEHRPPSPGFFAFSFLHPSFPPSRNSPFPDASSVCSPNALAHPLPRSLDHSLSCFLPPSNAFAHSLRSLAPLPPPHSLPTRHSRYCAGLRHFTLDKTTLRSMRKLHKTIKARLDGHTVGWGSENDRRQRCYATLPGSRAKERLRAALNFHVSYYSGKRARADESMNWRSLLELDPSNCPDDTMAALGRVVDHAHNIVPDRYVPCMWCVCVCDGA